MTDLVDPLPGIPSLSPHASSRRASSVGARVPPRPHGGRGGHVCRHAASCAASPCATGAFTPVRDRDVHTTPIPRLGGVAIYLGFVAAALVARAAALPRPALLDDARSSAWSLAGGIVCLRRGLRRHPRARLADQAGRADARRRADGLHRRAAALAADLRHDDPADAGAGALHGRSSSSRLTNAVNFIDGLDGLAAGVVGIAALAFFIYSYLVSRSLRARPTCSPRRRSSRPRSSAAAPGFLPHNFHPARLFMGDSGALLLGLLLAAATISTDGQRRRRRRSAPTRCSASLPAAPRAAGRSCCCRCSTCVLAVVRRTAGGPAAVAARRACTCTTACCGSATATAGRCSSSTSGPPSWPSGRCPSSSGTDCVPLAVVGVAAAMGVVLTVWLPRWRPSERL